MTHENLFLDHLLGKICDYELNIHPISAEGDSPITTYQ